MTVFMFVIKVICQWFVVFMLVIMSLATAKGDVEGKAATEPKGYKGIVETVQIMLVITLVLFGAGCFENLTGR